MSDLLVKALREGIEPYTGIPAAEATMDMAADEIERLQASLRMTNNQDSWMGRAFKLEAVLRPLLKHYLNCYDGLEDQLAKDARAALEGK